VSIMATEKSVPSCGEAAGYLQHSRIGEKPCDACREARRLYMAAYRARKAPGAVHAAMANRAASRAVWRLRHMHPTEYDLLFADEMRVESLAARREKESA
jgi:hypothetical protein